MNGATITRLAPRASFPHSPGLGASERAFINQFQGGFPVTGRPFSRVAARLGTTESLLLEQTTTLLDAGLLSRFGPLYNAPRVGGQQTLAALAVPPWRFDEVAETVNALDGVAHNYQRDHTLNMWFVVATESPHGVARTLDEIEARTGLAVLDFPKLHEFHIGLWLHLGDDGGVDTMPLPTSLMAPHPSPVVPHSLDTLDRALMAATQSGLPIAPDPYGQVARTLGEPRSLVLERLRAMLETGAIRRIGAIPNHYRLGLRANGMTVWDIPDERAEELGARVGALDFVSHCYLRPRRPGLWPYNLFAMVHGMDRAQVHAKAERIALLLGKSCRGRDTLFSTRVLKKTGLRIPSMPGPDINTNGKAPCSA